eukprot:TRINITY_DN43056_c0_g2_i1.p1 TRINITY_DN43056_c0_g2~~TRINITY_DN43056_c0_g2_i1.p1  ORF type:complete len:104 (+),score=0.63 TRINITY_DN43056_c0_g2_i1:442-753(+)
MPLLWLFDFMGCSVAVDGCWLHSLLAAGRSLMAVAHTPGAEDSMGCSARRRSLCLLLLKAPLVDVVQWTTAGCLSAPGLYVLLVHLVGPLALRRSRCLSQSGN